MHTNALFSQPSAPTPIIPPALEEHEKTVLVALLRASRKTHVSTRLDPKLYAFVDFYDAVGADVAGARRLAMPMVDDALFGLRLRGMIVVRSSVPDGSSRGVRQLCALTVAGHADAAWCAA